MSTVNIAAIVSHHHLLQEDTEALHAMSFQAVRLLKRPSEMCDAGSNQFAAAAATRQTYRSMNSNTNRPPSVLCCLYIVTHILSERCNVYILDLEV